MKIIIVCLAVLIATAGFAQETEAEEKKLQFEVSVGFSRINPDSIYDRNSGIDASIFQYGQYYQLTATSTGGYKESKLMVPFNISVNYHWKGNLYITAGIDYGVTSGSGEKSYVLSWPGFDETYDYSISDKLKLFMPRIGVTYRKGSLDLFGALGMGFAHLTHSELVSFTEPGYSYAIEDQYLAKGSGLAIIVGVKYKPKLTKLLGKKITPFLKLEAMILTIGTLKGSKGRGGADYPGQTVSEVTEGTIYSFQYNPYGQAGFDFWELCETAPTDPAITGIEKLSVSLSGIRLMIGISF